ncbi:MAG: hypothetical protein JRJ78_17080, partial [Deltaproteobacteria bacterium]|nr:hypothetical protein [Deltaproteobacteria bacterium]
ATSAVTEDKIGSGAVTSEKIGSGAVTGAKIADGIVSAWTDRTETSGSNTGYDLTNVKKIKIYYPGSFTHLTFSAELKATGGDTAYCRLSDGSNVSGQVTRNSTDYGWVDLSTSWDISGLGWTPGTWQNIYVQVKVDSSANTWYVRGVNIVWANS